MRDTNATLPGTALVAGGAGFVGSHLCDALLRYGGHVICVDRFLTGEVSNIAHLMDHPRFQLIVQDICQPFDPGLRVERVYNLACRAGRRHYEIDPVHTLMTSVLGTHNLLEIAKASGARFLQASTCDVNLTGHDLLSGHGDIFCPDDPRACYEQGKRSAETLCSNARRQYGMDVRIARIFSIYGPRMPLDDGRFLSALIGSALRTGSIPARDDPAETRSFCHVADLIPALLLLMECPTRPDHPVDIGDPREMPVGQIISLVQELTGSAVRRSGPGAEPLPASSPDIRWAQKHLGWQPVIPFTEGLDDTVNYLQSIQNVAAHPKREAAFLRDSRRSENAAARDP